MQQNGSSNGYDLGGLTRQSPSTRRTVWFNSPSSCNWGSNIYGQEASSPAANTDRPSLRRRLGLGT